MVKQVLSMGDLEPAMRPRGLAAAAVAKREAAIQTLSAWLAGNRGNVEAFKNLVSDAQDEFVPL